MSALVADQDDDLVARVQDVLDLELEASPRLKPPSPIDADALVAPIDVGKIRDQVPRPRRVPFDLRVDEGEVEVAPGKARNPLWVVDRLRHRAHDLHVLVRNKRSPARKLRVFIRRG